jgi:SAM-dependent methyltransferase
MPERRDPKSRFSDRVEDYERGRPGYPEELYDVLLGWAGATFTSILLDLGAGTGLSCAPLVRRGLHVVAVEPNAEMLAAAQRRLGGEPNFEARAGSAEQTGLDDASVDLVLAAQAFHWFDPAATRAELARVLRPPRRVALVWNARRAATTPFLSDYERLLLDFGTDYAEVGHRGVERGRLEAFYGGAIRTERFDNRQWLDRAGLRARLLSSSYVPASGEPRHEEMLGALEALFDRHQEDGRVAIDYDTELHLGMLA